jgi:hypothetical protein
MNPVYLAIKGTIPLKHALLTFVARKPVVNIVRAALPGPRRKEHWARLLGNIGALRSIAVARIEPERAVEIDKVP